MNSILTNRWTKAVLFLICLVPAGVLIWEAFTGGLGSNPTQFLEHATGDWTLRFVAITLSVTPLRKILGQPQLIRFRRMLGLFAFFYGFCHFSIYLTFDQVFDLNGIWADVMKRRYITVHGRMDSQDGWKALGHAAPRDLFNRHRGSHPLLLAGEIGRPFASRIRRGDGGSIGLACLCALRKTSPPRPGCDSRAQGTDIRDAGLEWHRLPPEGVRPK
jgi:hypothetical protein